MDLGPRRGILRTNLLFRAFSIRDKACAEIPLKGEKQSYSLIIAQLISGKIDLQLFFFDLGRFKARGRLRKHIIRDTIGKDLPT